MSDVFHEILVKREILWWRWMLDLLIVVTGLFIIALSMMYLGIFAVIPVVLVIFGAPILIKTRWLEYEYILTNDQLDIDKIVGRSRRRRMYTIDVREIELMAPMLVDFKEQFYNGDFKKNVDCSSNPRVPGRWFIHFNDTKDGRVRLVFEPDASMVRAMSVYAPRKVLGLDKLDELERDIAEAGAAGNGEG